MTFGDCDPRESSPAPAPTTSVSSASNSASASAAAKEGGEGYKKSFANSDCEQIELEWLVTTALIGIIYSLLCM